MNQTLEMISVQVAANVLVGTQTMEDENGNPYQVDWNATVTGDLSYTITQ